MSKFTRKTVVLAKLEVTPGTDIVPAGADAILVRNPVIIPLEMTYAERNIVRGFFGNFDAIPTIKKVHVTFEVEFQGSGTAGTAPPYGALLQACSGFETIVAVTSAAYTPLSPGTKTVSIYYNVDGLLHKIVFCRGNATLKMKANDIPFIAFDFIGLDTGATDVALVTPIFTTFKTPLAANKLNTPTFSLFGISALALESFELNFGNVNQQITRIGSEQVLHTDRKSVGSIMFEMTPVATKDWLLQVKNATLGALSLVHGTVAGSIATIAAPNVELQTPVFSDIQGIQMVQFALRFNPSNSGNDEWSITWT